MADIDLVERSGHPPHTKPASYDNEVRNEVVRQHTSLLHSNLRMTTPSAPLIGLLMWRFVDPVPLMAGVFLVLANAGIWLTFVDWGTEALTNETADVLQRRATMANVSGGVVWGLTLALMLPSSAEGQLLLGWVIPAAMAMNLVESASVRSSFLGFHLSFSGLSILVFAMEGQGAARWLAVVIAATAAMVVGLANSVRSGALQRAELSLRNAHLVEELTDANSQLRHRAEIDDLTGLLNRWGIERFMADHRTDGRSDPALAVFFVDLDGFKPVNDLHGHRKGDDVLIAVAHRLRDALPENLGLGRFGGDEFLIIAPGTTDKAILGPLAERIVSVVEESASGTDPDISITASVGVAVHRSDDLESTDPIRRADAAMYEAKRRGGNTWVLADEPTSSAPETSMHGRH